MGESPLSAPNCASFAFDVDLQSIRASCFNASLELTEDPLHNVPRDLIHALLNVDFEFEFSTFFG